MMDNAQLEADKIRLAELARESVIFSVCPECLDEFVEEALVVEQTPLAEKIVSTLIGMFEEEKEFLKERGLI